MSQRNNDLWQVKCDLLAEYIKEYGRLPTKSTAYKGHNLGLWVKFQKQELKKGLLSPDREAKLRSIGLDFERTIEVVLEENWQDWFEKVSEYVKENGRLPTRTPSTAKCSLAVWLRRQKEFFREGKLSPEREAKLRSIGVEFEKTRKSTEDASWQQKFELLVEYVKENGCLPAYDTIYRGCNLGNWFEYQKRYYRNGTLPAEREAKLRSINSEFADKSASTVERKWRNWFELLCEYMKETGRLPTFNTYYKGKNLSSWFGNQKQLYKEGKLSDDHEALFRSIGVDFDETKEDTDAKKWQMKFELLTEFVRENGCLPTQKTSYKGTNLGTWLAAQKASYRNKKLSPERENKLREIGVEFKPRVKQQD